MRTLVLAALLICGCSQSPPTLSGGKPASHWVAILKQSSDARLRKEAAFKLGNVGPLDPQACPALVEALKDSDAIVRCEAVLALLKFGAAAEEAVPSLTALRERDQDARVRTNAAKVLQKIQGGTS